jgi:multiple sugar transport system substrate-binding protein
MTDPTTTRSRPADIGLLSPGGSSRREFLVASGGALAGISLFGLAACGGNGGGDSGEVILSLTSNLEPTAAKQVKRFNETHPDGPNVTLRIMPQDTTQYFDQLRTQFQSGGGDISVIAGDVIWPPQFAEPGWISDLSDRFTADEQKAYLPGTIEAMVYEDQIWGVPWYTDSGLLYYRQDLLEQSGFSEPPQTWDELKEMAAKVQSDAGVADGFVFTGAVYEGGTVLGTEFIRTAGGDILDGSSVVISSPEAIEGLAIQQSLVSEGIAPQAVANFKEDETAGAFLRGDAVFMRQWPYAYDLLSDPEQSKIKPDQVGLGQVPVASPEVQPVNVGGGWNFYINASAADPDAAWEVIEFMSAPEQQKEMAVDLSLLPTRAELYEDKEILDALPAVKLGGEAFLNTTTPPVSPYYSDMSLAMAEQFNANVLGDVSPEEAAETLQSELETIIEKGG